MSISVAIGRNDLYCAAVILPWIEPGQAKFGDWKHAPKIKIGTKKVKIDGENKKFLSLSHLQAVSLTITAPQILNHDGEQRDGH